VQAQKKAEEQEAAERKAAEEELARWRAIQEEEEFKAALREQDEAARAKAAEQEEGRKKAVEAEIACLKAMEEKIFLEAEEARKRAVDAKEARKRSLMSGDLRKLAEDAKEEEEYKKKSAEASVDRKAAGGSDETPTFQVGDRVEYWSKTGGRWLDASILGICRHGVYDLDIKRGAQPGSVRHKSNMGKMTLEFDGAGRGNRYLTLSASEAVSLKRDYGNGWAKGQVLRDNSWVQCIFSVSSWQADDRT